MLREMIPAGYRVASKATDLVVPVETAREHETWTRDEWKRLDRLAKFLESKGIHIQLACTDERCQGAKLELQAQRSGRQARLICPHKERVWSQAH